MNFWSQRVNSNTTSNIFPPGLRLPNCHPECTWAHSEPDPGLCPHDFCQIISPNISRSECLLHILGICPELQVYSNQVEEPIQVPGQELTSDWHMGYEFVLSTEVMKKQCMGWNICLSICNLGSFCLNQIIIKTAVRKTMHNHFFPAYFSYLGYNLNYIWGTANNWLITMLWD